MKLLAPSYYPAFQCIASRCTHSCCVGWEIDIDSETLALYNTLSADYGTQIRESIDREETPHFRLCSGDRCPHLNENGLCKIILNLGESYLCEICREHPRFYHNTTHGMEVGLGMACEEACRLILSSDRYADFVELEPLAFDLDTPEFDAVEHRSAIYALLGDASIPYLERLERLSAHYGVTPLSRSDEDWREQIASLEYLDETNRSLFRCYTSRPRVPASLEKPLERALAYWILRHCSDALDAEELRSALGFCLLCERLLASLAQAENATDESSLLPLARILSEELEYSEENTETIISLFI